MILLAFPVSAQRDFLTPVTCTGCATSTVRTVIATVACDGTHLTLFRGSLRIHWVIPFLILENAVNERNYVKRRRFAHATEILRGIPRIEGRARGAR